MNTQKVQNLIRLSQDFIYAAKTNNDTSYFIQSLKDISYNTLILSLKTDECKKTFWINTYNAFIHSLLYKNPKQYEHRSDFFKLENIVIAGKKFSLNKIEHHILRRSKIKWGFGYFNNPFPDKIEKELRVLQLDYRIHFALNCGAKSCPPVAFYNAETINNQLDFATKAYLSTEVIYNEMNNCVYLPSLFNWFWSDFGGKKKIINLLKSLLIVPFDSNPTIEFKQYDWTLSLDNFSG